MGFQQAPDGLKAISVNGQMYYVDDEAIKGLQDRGIAYDDGSQYQQRDPVGAALRGGVHGATFGLADKKFGDSNESIMQRLGGDDYEQVSKESPIATGVGDLAGSLAVPIPGSGVGAGVKGLTGVLARAGREAAIGGATGALRAYAEGRNVDDAAEIGAALGGIGSAVSDVGGKVVNAGKGLLTKALDKTADAARVRGAFAIGGSDKQLAALEDRFGGNSGNLTQELASLIERTVPQDGYRRGLTRDDYKNILERLENTYGSLTTGMRQEASRQGVDAIIPQEWDAMRQDIEAAIRGTSERTQKGRELKGALERDLAAFDNAPTPGTVEGVAKTKSEYQEAGHTGTMGTIPEQASAESAATFGRANKSALDRLMGYTLPETEALHRMANDKTADVKLLLQQITPKAIREQLTTNAGGVGSAVIGALGGAAVGGAAGALTGTPTSGAITGAGLGAWGSTNTGTRNFVRQLLEQPQAMDTIANLARAAGKDLSAIDLQKLSELVQSLTGKAGGYAAQSP